MVQEYDRAKRRREDLRRYEITGDLSTENCWTKGCSGNSYEVASITIEMTGRSDISLFFVQSTKVCMFLGPIGFGEIPSHHLACFGGNPKSLLLRITCGPEQFWACHDI